YTFGSKGGDVRGPIILWQVIGSIASLLLLVIAAGLQLQGRWRNALQALAVEACLIVSMNFYFVLRDGVGRFSVGYEGTLRSLWVVVVGLFLRASVLFVLLRLRRGERESAT